jgi:hypothetical protein
MDQQSRSQYPLSSLRPEERLLLAVQAVEVAVVMAWAVEMPY